MSSITRSLPLHSQRQSRSYILNRGWIDRSAKRVPTYQEVTSSKSKGKQKATDESPFGGPGLDSDDEATQTGLPTGDPDIDEDDFEEIVDRFESSYNFRFEEPLVDATVLISYLLTPYLVTPLSSRHTLVKWILRCEEGTPQGRRPESERSKGRKRSFYRRRRRLRGSSPLK